MSSASETRVPCSNDTKSRLRAAKTGGITYDELFRRMLEQYEPQKAQEGW